MKKVLQLLIISALIILTMPLYAFAVTASLPDITVNSSDAISIPLTVNDMTNLEGMGVTVTFDELVIDATGATLTGGVLEGQNYGLQVNTATDGEIVIIIYANSTLYIGSGILAYIEFDVVGSSGNYTDLHFTQFDVNETSYINNTTDGSVTIPGGGPSASLPDVTAYHGGSISIPLTVNDMTSLEGMDVTVTFDELVIDATGTTLTGGVLDGQNYGLEYNTNTDGEIVIIIYANSTLYTGSGIVAYFQFDVVGSSGDYTDLHFTQFEVNETSYLGNTTDGSVTVTTSIDDVPTLINSFINKPNPFKGTTLFSFSLNKSSHVTIDIFNTKGQLIRHLLNEEMLADNHSIIWEGTNDSGEKIPAGIYFIRIITKDSEIIHKVIAIK